MESQTPPFPAVIVVGDPTREIDQPAEAHTIGALLQLSRLFRGEVATAFMQTYVLMRVQLHCNLIVLHIDGIARLTLDRIAAVPNAFGIHASDQSLLRPTPRVF